ncbi:MAG: hypothetical protein CK427_06175 [Leptospira sp.]|nr:MAG: hypothetical protein CK427_06175 [Leptospira sp.]
MTSVVTYPAQKDTFRGNRKSIYYSIREQNPILNTLTGVSIIVKRLHYARVKVEFDELKEKWLKDIMFTSNYSEIINHYAYRQIISLGFDAIPFIVSDLKENNNHWFHALNKITGSNPIKEESRGNALKMKKDWLDFLSEKYDGIENIAY